MSDAGGSRKRRTKESPCQSERQLRLLLENMEDTVCMHLPDGTLAYVSPSCQRLLGYTPEELVDTQAADHVYPDDLPAINAIVSDAVARHEEHYRVQHRMKRKDGGHVWVETAGRLLYGPDGHPREIQCNVRDISERKKREQWLRESEERFRGLFENAPLGYQSLDVDGNFIEVNQTWCELLGYTREEVLGKNFSEFIHPDFKENFKENFPKFKSFGYILGIEFEMIRKDGSEIIVAFDGRVGHHADGSFKQTHCVLRDVTERVLAEETRKEYVRFLETLATIDRAIHGSSNLDQMLNEVIETVLRIFKCDRAWLLYPCDPDASLLHVPIESTRPEFPGVKTLGITIPMTPPMRSDIIDALAADGPVAYGPGNEKPMSADTHDQFGVQSQMFVSIQPQSGDAWIFGMHQCSHDRVWTDQEKRLFNEIGRRIADGLSSLLFLRNIEQSEERYRITAEKTGQMVYDYDPETRGIKWEGAVEALTGYSKEAFRSFNIDGWEMLIHPNDRESVVRELKESRRKCSTYDVEYRLRQKDGNYIHVEDHGIFLPDADGQAYRMLGSMSDVTERKRAEGELRQLRNYLSNIINSMPSVLVGVDSDGMVTQWNAEAQRCTGVTAADATGQPLARAFPRLAAEMERVREAMRTRQVRSDSKRARKENNEIRYEDVTVYPLITNGVEGAVIRVDDVTDRVRIEEMMVQSEKMMSVGGLAAGMAHEINNPLAGMMQTAAVLESRLTENLPVNDRAAEEAGTTMEAIRAFMVARDVPGMVERIRESGSRAAEIVSNMLSFARKSDSIVSKHNLAELLDQSVDLAGSDYDLKKKYDFRQIEIIREYEEHLPEVPCEAAKIQQVLLNILRNGAEAMQEEASRKERGKPRFILRTAHDKAAGMLRVEIEDNGPGMDEETRKRVFEPFFTTKPTDRGTGLGLSVSYFIVTENHGGKMSVESRLGAGSTFSISLPVKRSH